MLGDSSGIVTETNPALLQDQVVDLKPAVTSEEAPPAATGKQDSVAASGAVAATPPPANDASGLTVAFKEVTISLPGVTTREQPKAMGTARGASFTLSSGSLAKSTLVASGATISKVTQRYTTVLRLTDDDNTLTLDNLSTTGGFEPLEGSGGRYALTALGQPEGKYPDASRLRAAVQQAARKQHLSRKASQDWLDFVRDPHYTQSAGQQLKNVVWRIEGKDASGKAFTKELRIDVPL